MLTSVTQLSRLSHLSSIDAEYCSITDVAGLSDLDTLVNVNLKGNKIISIAFESTAWERRLESLDLSENSIEMLSGLGSLKRLKAIDLG